ncbi:hypothetical protein [Halomarina litorea]|uniref:hypothetical protein n=1 Tax=Halomarina litorea TaxID=2961595 RepID=UPI0020C3DB6D|nr:hypothetical protein [Halomarina sp. BCD28]
MSRGEERTFDHRSTLALAALGGGVLVGAGWVAPELAFGLVGVGVVARLLWVALFEG